MVLNLSRFKWLAYCLSSPCRLFSSNFAKTIFQGYKHAILTWTWKSRVALKMKPYSCMDWGQDPHNSVFLAVYLQGTLGKEPIYRHISTKQQFFWMIIKAGSFSTSGSFPNEGLNNILQTVTKLKYCQCNVISISACQYFHTKFMLLST